MEKHPSPIPLSKYGKRELSPFAAGELLYDYHLEKLDSERAESVRDVLGKHAHLKRDLARIQSADLYLSLLGKARPPADTVEKIDEPDTYLSVLLKKTNYERWPLTIRWGIEAAVVLCVFLVVLIVMPWNQLLNMGLSPQGREIILAEMDHGSRNAFDDGLTPMFSDESAGFEDEGVKPLPTSTTTADVVVPSIPAVATTGVTIPQVQLPVVPPAKTPPPAATVVSSAKEAKPVAEVPADTSKKPGEGALYRGILKVTNLDATGLKIIEKIEELGGRKAGQVELGWKKTATSSYFHFTMPQAKYDELISFLAAYGSPRIQKEKHPRVMPEGIVRLIIEVEEAEK
ncbi:MAG: hypothetical protein KF789_03725 [Bdellovibrionaceae bacterium]|nr:hypothetical protein [Pseudobdellovibrionaceae bacterium]